MFSLLNDIVKFSLLSMYDIVMPHIVLMWFLTPVSIFSFAGKFEDLALRVTNMHNEDKDTIVIAWNVFDVPIRKDIIHCAIRWQLEKRQQVLHALWFILA